MPSMRDDNKGATMTGAQYRPANVGINLEHFPFTYLDCQKRVPQYDTMKLCGAIFIPGCSLGQELYCEFIRAQRGCPRGYR